MPLLRGLTWLTGVVAVTPTDVWAVGGTWVERASGDPPAGVFRTLIEHWDGTSWQVAPSPNPGRVAVVRSRWGKEPASSNQLYGIAAVSANDIWAVGEHARALQSHRHRKRWPYSGRYVVRPLVEHWNGTSWTLRPHPNRSVTVTYLDRMQDGFADPAQPLFTYPQAGLGFDGVSAAPSGDVLALAALPPLAVSVWQANGTGWSRLSGYRTTPKGYYGLDAAIVTAHNDVWVTGTDFGKLVAGAHWDGTQWTKNRLPAQGFVDAAAATGPDDVWEAGSLQSSNATIEVMLHYAC
jgi:hypothetical protein